MWIFTFHPYPQYNLGRLKLPFNCFSSPCPHMLRFFPLPTTKNIKSWDIPHLSSKLFWENANSGRIFPTILWEVCILLSQQIFMVSRVIVFLVVTIDLQVNKPRNSTVIYIKWELLKYSKFPIFHLSSSNL